MRNATGVRGVRDDDDSMVVVLRNIKALTVLMTTVMLTTSATGALGAVTPSVTTRDANRFGSAPSGRGGAAHATFAAANGRAARLVVFGGIGIDGEEVNDVWEFDAVVGAGTGGYDGNWTRLHDGAGTAPRGRTGAVACALRDDVYVFGGYISTGGITTTCGSLIGALGVGKRLCPPGARGRQSAAA